MVVKDVLHCGAALGALVVATALAPAPAQAGSTGVAATVAGAPITMVAYHRRLRLLYALPLMNDPMRVPVPPADAWLPWSGVA
jgi:hypothetical protein